ncbi:hypothetical protein GW781_01020 [bacterium]|nr:hypothetical protein [bacterium]
MKYTNRVVLQGYLDVVNIGETVLDTERNLRTTVIRATLIASPEMHKVVIAGAPALAMIEMLKKIHGGTLLSADQTLRISDMDGRPFVALEGELQDGMVIVSWLTILSVPDAPLLRLLSDEKIRDVAMAWEKISPIDRELISKIARSALFSPAQQIKHWTWGQTGALSLPASSPSSPSGKPSDGLPSKPPVVGRKAPRP